jgi:hypothetical protein
MYAPLTPDDEITGSEDTITLDEVTARLKAIRPFRVEDTQVPETAMHDPAVEACVTREDAEDYIAAQPEDEQEHLEVVEYSDESYELAELRDLKAEMRAHTGGHSGHVTAVREDHLEDYARDTLESIYGEEAIDSVGCHVNWEAVAAEMAIDMTATTFRGSSYYITTH